MSETPEVSFIQGLKPRALGEEAKDIRRFFALNTWQYFIIIGIAISGIAAFVNTYDAWRSISKKMQECTNSNPLKKELKIQFIVMLTLSILTLLLGLILLWIFRNKENQRRLITLGTITIGILGIVYSISIKLQDVTNIVKLGVSWVSFAAFLVLGFFFSRPKLPWASESGTTQSE
jgi:heme O synthase-like polyprenyltransferase